MRLPAAEIKSRLDQYWGTEGYHFTPITKAVNMVYTDGVKEMAELCGAWWLLDLIASYQHRCMKDESLQGIQFWTLTVKDGKGIVMCERDTDDVFLTQELSYTDFPLDEMKVWLELGETSFGQGPVEVMVAMLPSER